MSYANYLRAGVRDTKKPAGAGFFRIFARGYLDFCPRVFGFLARWPGGQGPGDALLLDAGLGFLL